ncbi:hypothetical protein TERG_08209 [Paecilomyces variotii No. 5]|uniref:Potassium channel tetramerisation-type BTB domain-containing protein n=1 Tax=Byssochlamys spectabilis (strain No. 5 / NBRC 109023) TaxID=1356009 RepID=V5G500_BYSSN|nr:hypothetical protein TERG_08209 [Paecilomyces variotii No. 5]
MKANNRLNRRDVFSTSEDKSSAFSRHGSSTQGIVTRDAVASTSSRSASALDDQTSAHGFLEQARSSAIAESHWHSGASWSVDGYPSDGSGAVAGLYRLSDTSSPIPLDILRNSYFQPDWNTLDTALLDTIQPYRADAQQGFLQASKRSDGQSTQRTTAAALGDLHRSGGTGCRKALAISSQTPANRAQLQSQSHCPQELSDFDEQPSIRRTTANSRNDQRAQSSNQPARSAIPVSSSVATRREGTKAQDNSRGVGIGQKMSEVAEVSGSTTPTGPNSVQPPSGSRGSSVSSRKGSRPKCTLPAERVFPIQIGAPSYFSQFFEEQMRQNEDSSNIRTLYIDRDPVTFQEISRHLQGYYVRPKDGSQFVKLFADAQFYSLPRLISQLFESEIFIQIGADHFQIPRDIFSSPGDTPNFFSLGFGVFFASRQEVFPGLDRNGLLRPPSIVPPNVSSRSGKVFAELLHLLRGYPLHIRNEDHRAELLRDCRYFHLRGLEQKLIPHDISYNPERRKSEIIIRLEDVRQSGVSFVSDSSNDNPILSGWVHYARPFVDETTYELIVEIGGENTTIDLNAMRADFHGLAKARIASLFQVVANKMNLPTNAPLGLMMMSGGASAQAASPGHTPLSQDRVKVQIGPDADVTVDGEPYIANLPRSAMGVSREQPQVPQGQDINKPLLQHAGMGQPSTKRKRVDNLDDLGDWIVYKGQWRLRVQPDVSDRGGLELVFIAVKLDVYTGQRARNKKRTFLS